MAPLSVLIPASGPCDPQAMHEVLARTARTFMNAASVGASVPTETLIKESAPRADYRPLLEQV